MKSAEETLQHLAMVISHIYVRPEMYALTPAELNTALFNYHHIWGFISDRKGEVIGAHADLRVAEGEGPIPDWHYERVKLPSRTPFEPIISRWRKVDERIGLDSTYREDAWPTPPQPLR